MFKSTYTLEQKLLMTYHSLVSALKLSKSLDQGPDLGLRPL